MQPEIEESRPCPQCGEAAVPELDRDLKFWACPECGAEFGYVRVVSPDPVCAAGLPVEVVAGAAQPPGVMTLKSGENSTSVFLGTTIQRRSDD
jgi:hypothetical protein